MYYGLNIDKVELTNPVVKLKDGDHLLYRWFSFREDYKPEIIVIDISKGHNARSINTKSIRCSDGYMKQCIDPSEVEICNEETHPEYYV